METLYDSICNLTKISFIGFCNEFESSEYYQPIMELIREAANKGKDAQLYFYGNGFKAWVSSKSSTKGTLCVKWINPIRKNCINGDEN